MADETCVPLLLSCVPSNGPAAREYTPSLDVVGQNPGYVAATLLGLAGIVIAYVLYRRALRPKILDYDVDVDSPMLASASKRVHHELSVSWKGELVEEPKIVEVVIANTGKEAVVREDYTDAITITVDSGRLLEATLRGSHPKQAVKPDDLSVGGDGRSVTVLPQLLNKGDRFLVQLIVDGFGAKVVVSSRFTNQERPMRNTDLGIPKSLSLGPKVAASAMAVIAVLAFAFLPTASGTSTLAIIGWRALYGALIGGLSGTLVFMLWSTIVDWRWFRRSSQAESLGKSFISP